MKRFVVQIFISLGLLFATAVSAQNLSEHIVKQKNVSVGVLQQIRVAANQSNRGLSETPIVFPLFDGQSVTLILDRIELRSANDFSWIGRVEGHTNSLAILVVKNGNITGQIEFSGKHYEVNPAQGNVHNLIEIDDSLLPSLDHDVLDEADPLGVLDAGLETSAESFGTEAPYTGEAAIIDLLAVYSLEAAQFYPDVEQRIQLAVDWTNQAYINSGVVHRVNLVGAVALEHNESGLNTELYSFGNLFDGQLDYVHDLRQQYNADVVSIWLNYISGLCGQANAILSSPVAPSHITRVSCGSRTFAHELGHNQGARHNMEQDDTLYPFPYGHGAGSPTNQWLTIMSYSNACDTPCPAIQYFSTPDVSLNGEPLGSVDREDNARVINETGLALSQFDSIFTTVQPATVEAFTTDGNHSVTLEEIYPGTWYGTTPLPAGGTNWLLRVDGEQYGAVNPSLTIGSNFSGEMSINATSSVLIRTFSDAPFIVLYDERYRYAAFRSSAPAQPTLHFRGTPNSWATNNAMTHLGFNLWVTDVVFTGEANQRFKFDVYGDWTENYGGDNTTTDADLIQGGSDIYTTVSGAYRVYADMSNRDYWMVPAGNLPPVADAGPDITVRVGETFTLDGSGSFDPDGTIDSYYWDFVQLQGQVVETQFSSVGEVTITLIVRDNEGAVGTDQVVVTITDDASFDSVYPQANLRGTSNAWASSPMTLVDDYTWQITEPFGSAANERFKFDIYGDWSTNFGDNNGDGVLEPAGDDITITEGAGDYLITFNDQTLTYSVVKVVGPVANAGADVNVRPGDTVTFDGSASSGPATIVSYEWTSSAWTTALSGTNPSFTFNDVGVYPVTLVVTDENSATATDTMTVNVQANTPPTAVIANGNISVTVGETIVFDGSTSSDQDGSIATYAWDNGDSTSTSTRTFDTEGTFTITLQVTDNEGATSQIVSVTVTVEQAQAGTEISFTCNNGSTSMGTSVYVVGNIPELGNWSVASAAQVLGSSNYPQWQAVLQSMPSNTTIEWKCVKALESTLQITQWQGGANNQVTTSASGSYTSTGSF